MRTLGTLFTGGGGFECGAVAAGLTPIWGIEYDPEIASVYDRNFGPHIICANVEDVDYARLTRPDWLHMSPVCKNASVAKKDGQEAAEDLSSAEACARAIRSLSSPFVSLENVWGYRNFESFRIILRALEESGYAFDYWHLNAADYGVPQTRKRLILLASKTRRPRRPKPTHAKEPPAQVDLFSPAPLLRWEGWYRAIEDLIPTLPESRFAEWQLKRLPAALGRYLMESKFPGRNALVMYKKECEPAPTVTALDPRMRAFICEATAAGVDNKFTMPVRPDAEPIFTVRPEPNIPRAFILDCQDAGTPDENGERKLTVRDGGEPTFTVSASMQRRPARAWLSCGRVVSMTPRALARFQSIPDSYVLPEKAGLACKLIGNAVAPLLTQRVIESVRVVNTERSAA